MSTFVAYHSKDSGIVRTFVEDLEELDPALDLWFAPRDFAGRTNLKSKVREIIEESSCFLFCLGTAPPKYVGDKGPMLSEEIRFATQIAKKNPRFKIVPIRLRGAARLPSVLGKRVRVDLSRSREKGIERIARILCSR